MTEPEQAPSVVVDGSANTEIVVDGADTDEPSRARKVAKGCGCVTVSAVLATSVAIAAGGDGAAWAAGISGVLFLVMVVATSGSNGFWGLRG